MNLAVFPSLQDWTDLWLTFWLWPTSWKPLRYPMSHLSYSHVFLFLPTIFSEYVTGPQIPRKEIRWKRLTFFFYTPKCQSSPDCGPFAPLWEVSAHDFPCTNVFESFLSSPRGVLVPLRGFCNLEMGVRYWRCIRHKSQSITTTLYIPHLLERRC